MSNVFVIDSSRTLLNIFNILNSAKRKSGEEITSERYCNGKSLNVFNMLGSEVGKTLDSVNSENNFVLTSVGSKHGFALDEYGKLWSYGYNHCGQLELGNFAYAPTLTQIISDSYFTTVYCYNEITLALDEHNVLWFCGAYDFKFINVLIKVGSNILALPGQPIPKNTIKSS